MLSVMANEIVSSFLSLRFNTSPGGMTYLTFFLFTLFGLFVTWFVGFLFVWPRNKIKQGLRSFGVAIKRVSRTIQELERKTCKFAIPLYYIHLKYFQCLSSNKIIQEKKWFELIISKHIKK